MKRAIGVEIFFEVEGLEGRDAEKGPIFTEGEIREEMFAAQGALRGIGDDLDAPASLKVNGLVGTLIKSDQGAAAGAAEAGVGSTFRFIGAGAFFLKGELLDHQGSIGIGMMIKGEDLPVADGCIERVANHNGADAKRLNGSQKGLVVVVGFVVEVVIVTVISAGVIVRSIVWGGLLVRIARFGVLVVLRVGGSRGQRESIGAELFQDQEVAKGRLLLGVAGGIAITFKIAVAIGIAVLRRMDAVAMDPAVGQRISENVPAAGVTLTFDDLVVGARLQTGQNRIRLAGALKELAGLGLPAVLIGSTSLQARTVHTILGDPALKIGETGIAF